MPAADEAAARTFSSSVDPFRETHVLAVERSFEPDDGVELEVAAEYRSHQIGMLLDDVQRPVLDPIAERNDAAHPYALLLRGRDLVADSLARNLPLELGEGQQHIEHQPAHARGRVEGLRDGNERHAMCVEELHQLGEVGKRTGEAIHLVDDDDVDPALFHVVEQFLQRRSLYRTAGKAAVVVTVADQLPAFMGLALDIGLRGFALIVERVELLLETAVGGDAGVNCAPEARLMRLRRHGTAPGCGGVDGVAFAGLAFARSAIASVWRPDRKPKKRWPFQLVPVIALATIDRLA